MHDIKQNHHTKHERRVKNIKEVLVPEQVAVIPHEVLDDAEDRADHDQR